MAATPSTQSINGFTFDRPASLASFRGDHSRLNAMSASSGAGGADSGRNGGMPSDAQTESMTQNIPPLDELEEEEYEPLPPSMPDESPFAAPADAQSHSEAQEPNEWHAPIHSPAHPNHQHPGYEALVADQAYAQEEAQMQAMLKEEEPVSLEDAQTPVEAPPVDSVDEKEREREREP